MNSSSKGIRFLVTNLVTRLSKTRIDTSNLVAGQKRCFEVIPPATFVTCLTISAKEWRVQTSGTAGEEGQRNWAAGGMEANSLWGVVRATLEKIWDIRNCSQTVFVHSLVRTLIFSVLIASSRWLATTYSKQSPQANASSLLGDSGSL